MDTKQDYYQLLHVLPDAPAPVIKASYRTLMQKLKYHPDLGGDDWNASVINEAYRVLSDSGQRAAYDAEQRSHLFVSMPELALRAGSLSHQQARATLGDRGQRARPLLVITADPHR